MKQLATLALVLIVTSACTNKDQLKKIITENPDIVFSAIEKNPAKFMEVVQKASVEAQKSGQEDAEKKEKEALEEELKNPKNPVLADNRATLGTKGAPITLVEYSDFQCPYCKRGYDNVEELLNKYKGQIYFMFKHLPLDFHPLAMPAAKMFEAIAIDYNSEMAYKFHDEIFKNQKELGSGGEKFLEACAKKAGVKDIAKLKKTAESEAVKTRIDADMAEAKSFGFSGTPGFVIAGVSVKGAYPVSHFEMILEKKGLKK